MFKYLSVWQKLFFIFSFFVAFLEVVGIIASRLSRFGIGDFLIIYACLQSINSLKYAGLKKKVIVDNDTKTKNMLANLEKTKVVYWNYSFKATLVIWLFAIGFFLFSLLALKAITR